MAHPDKLHRKQLFARLKSAITTAAIVGTLGGWLAFGSHQTPTTVASTSTGASVPAVAQSAASNSTTATNSTTAAAATSSTANQSSSSPNNSAPQPRQAAVTSTCSSP